MIQSPDSLNGITAHHASLLMNVGIGNIGVLQEAMKVDFWTRQIPGVGEETGKKLVYAMYRAGIIDDTFEAYKETDRKYYLAKCGIDFDGLCKAFPKFPIEEIERVYMRVRKMGNAGSAEQDVKCCGYCEEKYV